MRRDNGKVDGIFTSSYGQEDRTVGLGLEIQVSSRQRQNKMKLNWKDSSLPPSIPTRMTIQKQNDFK